MKFFFLLGLFFWSQNYLSQDIESHFSKFIADKDLSCASIGFSVIDQQSGEALYQYRGTHSLMSASTMKLITTSSALEIFGKEHTFSTKLLLRGRIIDGVLHGDLIIRGEGDPTLGSQEFLRHYGDVLHDWATAIQTLGIKEIRGHVIGDDTYFGGISLVGSTAVKDIGNYYGAGAHALSAYENAYSIYFKSPNKDNSPTTLLRTIPPDILEVVQLTNEVRSSTINKDNAYIYGIPDSDFQVVKGTIPMNKNAFKIKGSIPDPAKLWAHQLTKTLNQRGISVTEAPLSYLGNEEHLDYHPELLQVIHTITSPPLSEIVNYTNKKSVNTYANILIKNLGKKIKNEGTYKAGVAAIQEYWKSKGVDIEGWYQEDGSGLSRANAITANQLTQIITMITPSNKEALKSGLKDFAKSGRRIITKSGYMNRVRSFAGYMTLKDGREVAFSILANNYACSPSAMRKKIEALLLSM